MASETPRIYAMFGWKFTLGVEKCCHSFPKDAILANIWLQKCRKSDGGNPKTTGICSRYAVTPEKYAFVNLVNDKGDNIGTAQEPCK